MVSSLDVPPQDDNEIPLKEYYVYVLIDPRLKGEDAVFYVGKGKGRRALAHGELAKRFEGEALSSRRLDRINDIRKSGHELLTRVVARVDSEEEAHSMETLLIQWVYRLDRLTNLVSGHDHKFFRHRHDWAERARLDVPATVAGERSGEYTKELIRNIEKYGIEEGLETWGVILRQEAALEVLAVNLKNKTAPELPITLWDPFALRLIKRPSSKSVANLLFGPSSPAMRARFVSAVQKPAFRKHIVDGKLKGSASSPYFYFTEHRRAAVGKVEPVLAAIELLKQLTGCADR